MLYTIELNPDKRYDIRFTLKGNVRTIDLQDVDAETAEKAIDAHLNDKPKFYISTDDLTITQDMSDVSNVAVTISGRRP